MKIKYNQSEEGMSKFVSEESTIDTKKYFTFLKIFLVESARKDYFERNFAWHAITQFKGDLSANLNNATIIFLRPSPESSSKDRLGIIKTTYNLKQEPEITSAFYFDLALRTFLAIR